MQVVSDDARAQGVPSPQSLGESRMGAGERQGAGKQSGRARQTSSGVLAELAAHSDRAVSEVCTHPPGLLRDEPAAECSVAPTAADSPFFAGGSSLSSGRSSLAPRPRGARARSIARDVDAKFLFDEVLDFYVKATGEVQMRQKLLNMRPAALQQCRER